MKKEEEQLNLFSSEKTENSIKKDIEKEEAENEINNTSTPFSKDNLDTEFYIQGNRSTLTSEENLIADSEDIYSSIAIFKKYNDSYKYDDDILVVYFDDENVLAMKEKIKNIEESFNKDKYVVSHIAIKDILEPIGERRVENALEILHKKISKLNPERKTISSDEINDEIKNINEAIESGDPDLDDIDEEKSVKPSKVKP